MFPIKNTKVKEFCKDVFDIDYIVGWDISKRDLNSEQNYIDLALVYSFNSSRINLGQKPYVQILTDDKGSRYAQLSEDGVQYALNNDLSFMSECKERDKRNIPLKKVISRLSDDSSEDILLKSDYSATVTNEVPSINALSKFVDDSLEDRICERCGNVLGLNMTRGEALKIIGNILSNNKINPNIYSGKNISNKDPWADVFLTLKDIPGAYMN